MKHILLPLLLVLASCASVEPDHKTLLTHPFATPTSKNVSTLIGEFAKGSFLSNRAVVVRQINGIRVFDHETSEDSKFYIPSGEVSVSYYYHHTREQAHVDFTFTSEPGSTYRVMAAFIEKNNTVRMWIEDDQTKEKVTDLSIVPLEPTNKPRPLPLHAK